MIKLLFWASAAFVFYVYVGYPLLIWFLQLFTKPPDENEAIQPSVSLLIAAYNEGEVIAEKLRNSLALDYPADRLEIVVASDGSQDSTCQIVRSIASREGRRRIRLLEFAENRGKVAALNEAVPQLRGDIIVFSDASSMLQPESLQRLARHFADSSVGGVSGVYRVVKSDQATLAGQEDLYWKYETFLKVCEARLGGFTGAHGSLYAVRRSLYPFPSPDIINDDFVIPLRIQNRGYRIAYEPSAVAYEQAHEMEGFSRRVRITAGNVEQLKEIAFTLWPLKPLAAFCLLSHKTCRLAVPPAMLLLLIANLALLPRPLYMSLLVAQSCFYALAVFGGAGLLRHRVLKLPYYFCMVNSALFAWMYHALRLRRPIPSRIELDRIGDRSSTAR